MVSNSISGGAKREIRKVTTAMTEMSQRIMDVAKNAADAASTSREATETANKGKGRKVCGLVIINHVQ